MELKSEVESFDYTPSNQSKALYLLGFNDLPSPGIEPT